MSRVFIPEPNDRYDLSAATEWGEVLPLLKCAAPFNPEGVMIDFINAFDEVEFNPADDFICLSGQTIALALMMSTALLKFNKIKVLMFDARNSDYIQRNIDRDFLPLKDE